MSLNLTQKRRSPEEPGYFRIGDIVLDLPPESIETVRLANNEEITALRSKHPMHKKTGYERLDAIITWKAVLDYSSSDPFEQYKKVQRILAFFKAAPFIEVENAHLRSIIQQDRLTDTEWSRMAFALRHLRVSTLPDMADALQITLRMTWFNYKPFSVSFDYIGGGGAHESELFTGYIDRWIGQNLDSSYQDIKEGDLDLSWRLYEVFQVKPPGSPASPQAQPGVTRPTVPAKPPNIGTSNFFGSIPLLNLAGAKITSKFGNRKLSGESNSRLHAGIDIAGVKKGTNVSVVAGGIVTFAGIQGGYGNIVTVKHPTGVQTAYAHLDSILVILGQEIKAGDVIGTVGNTGRSVGATGVHLHYEVRVNGRAVNPEQISLSQLTTESVKPAEIQASQTVPVGEAGEVASIQYSDNLDLPASYLGLTLDHHTERVAFYYSTKTVSMQEDDESMYPVQLDVVFINNLIPVPIENQVMPTYQHIGSPSTMVSINLLSNGELAGDSEPLHDKLSEVSAGIQDLDHQFHHLRAEWRAISSVFRMQSMAVKNRLLAMLGVESILPFQLSTETIADSPNLVQATLMGPEYTNVYEQIKGYRIKNAGAQYKELWGKVIDGEVIQSLPADQISEKVKNYADSRLTNNKWYLARGIREYGDDVLIPFPSPLDADIISDLKTLMALETGGVTPSGIIAMSGVPIATSESSKETIGSKYPLITQHLMTDNFYYTDYVLLEQDPLTKSKAPVKKVSDLVWADGRKLDKELGKAAYDKLFHQMLMKDTTFAKDLQKLETAGPVSEAFKNVDSALPGGDPKNSGHGAYRDMGLQDIRNDYPSPAYYFVDESKRLSDQLQKEVEGPLVRSQLAINTLNLPVGYTTQPFESNPDEVKDFLKTVLSKSKVPAISMARAFPAIKLFFMEEDNSGLYYAYDDFYSYNSILSLEVGRSIDKTEIAIVTLSNFSNILSQRFFDNTVWGKLERKYDPYRRERGASNTGEALVGSDTGRSVTEAAENKAGLDLSAGFTVAGKKKASLPPSMLQYLGLQAGTKVQIRVGFDNDPDKLVPIFTGHISEIQQGEVMTIVCQSYMSELMQLVDEEHEKYPGSFLGMGKGRMGGAWKPWNESGDAYHVISKMMEMSNAAHFGRWQIDPTATPFMRSWTRKPLQTLPDIRKLNSDSTVLKAVSFMLGLYSNGYQRQAENIRISRFITGNGQSVSGDGASSYVGRPYNYEQTFWQVPLNSLPAYRLPDYKSPKTYWEVMKDISRRYPEQILCVKPYGFPFQADATLVFSHPNDLYFARPHIPGEVSLDRIQSSPTNDVLFSSWWKQQGGRQQFQLRIRAFNEEFSVGLLLGGTLSRMLLDYLPGAPTTGDPDSRLIAYIDQGQLTAFLQVRTQITNLINMLKGVVTSDQGWNQTLAALLTGVMPDFVNRAKQRYVEELTNLVQALNVDFLRLSDAAPPDRMKMTRNWHIVTSAQIVKNEINLNDDVYNAVKIKEDVISASDHIIGDAMRILDVTSSIILPEENCKSDQWTQVYAQSFLKEQVAKMYQGELILSGSPEIEPHDVLVLADPHRQMHGPIEVASVSHIFDQESGFITVIKPQALVLVNEKLGAGVFSALSDFVRSIPSEVTNLYEGVFGNAQGRQGLDETEAAVAGMTVGGGAASTAMMTYFTVKGARKASQLAATRIAASTVAQGLATRAAGLLVPGMNAVLVASTLYSATFGFYSMALKRQKANPLFIIPLMQYDQPYVAGIQGWQVSDLATMTVDGFKYEVATEIKPTIEGFKEWQGIETE